MQEEPDYICEVDWERYQTNEALMKVTNTFDFSHMEEYQERFGRKELLDEHLKINASQVLNPRSLNLNNIKLSWGICVARWRIPGNNGHPWIGVLNKNEMIRMFKHIAMFHIIGAEPVFTNKPEVDD